MKLYAIVDRKAKSVVSVFSSLNNETAERSFLMLLTGTKNIFTDFPEDFDLYPVADLKFSGVLTVSAQGLENLNNNGFKVDTFDVVDAIKLGVDYDKRYLAMVHNDRFSTANESDIPNSESEVI